MTPLSMEMPNMSEDPENDSEDQALQSGLIAYIDEYFPTKLGEEMTELHDEYIDAVRKDNQEKLESLYEHMNEKISYLQPKMRDTIEQKDYMNNLEKLHEQLLEKITRPEK